MTTIAEIRAEAAAELRNLLTPAFDDDYVARIITMQPLPPGRWDRASAQRYALENREGALLDELLNDNRKINGVRHDLFDSNNTNGCTSRASSDAA